MASSEVYVFVTMTPKPEKYDDSLQALQEFAKTVEKEESGALFYQVFGNKDKGEIVVFEKYKDKAASQAHSQTAHYKALTNESVETLKQPPVFTVVSDPSGFSRG